MSQTRQKSEYKDDARTKNSCTLTIYDFAALIELSNKELNVFSKRRPAFEVRKMPLMNSLWTSRKTLNVNRH